ncbi:hypothetical protein BDZ89DRAFT_1144266 [Hymenopellis radicata]|nr:hypothetical protein BDZ89DRAFT_1144266 [Hymenopellis radicata]
MPWSPRNYPSRAIATSSTPEMPSTQNMILSSDTSASEDYVFPPPDSLFHKVLMVAEVYALNLGPWSAHQDVDRATLSALKTVVESDVFGTSTVMTPADEGFILHTSALESEAVDNGWELLTRLFTYVSCFATHSFAAETIYAYLVRQDWLHDIEARLSRLSHTTTPEADRLPACWRPGYVYVAVTYLNGLSSGNGATSEAISEAKEYIEEPAHLSTLSKILLFGDSDTQNMLWKLAATIRSDAWSACIEDLSTFIACDGMADEYDDANLAVHVDVHSYRRVYYRPLQDLPSLITTVAMDLKRNHVEPPTYTKPKEDSSQVVWVRPELDYESKRSVLKSWWTLLGHKAAAHHNVV